MFKVCNRKAVYNLLKVYTEYVSCEFLFGGSQTILEFSLTLQPSIRIDYSDIGDMMVKQKLWFG